MSHNLSDEAFLAAFTQRVKAIREMKGLSQAQMAKLLDISQGTYHKYECRTLMPHKLLMRFCYETTVDIGYVYYGRAAGSVPSRARGKASLKAG